MLNKDRLHRSELAVPASNLRMLEKAPEAGADIVFLDLEDAVAPDDKVQARKNAIEALQSQDWSKTATSVRINGLDTEWGHDDLRAASAAGPDATRSEAEGSKDEGPIIDAEVVDLRSIRPLDKETILKSVKKTNKVLLRETAASDGQIIGASAATKKLLDVVRRAAPTDANVLILGENGTGKELIARELHRQSNRADRGFLTIDMGSISESLFESELFGHKKGAFTDASEDRLGRFQAADGGTVFLDEIGNLPLEVQAILLRVLESGCVAPLGSSREEEVDFRLIAATNTNLELITTHRYPATGTPP